MRSLTSSPDRICILSRLSWKEGEKEDKKRERKKERKKRKRGRRKRKKGVRKKREKKKKLDLSRINLVPEFGL